MLPQQVELALALDDADDEAALKRATAAKLGVSPTDLAHARIVRRSIDARKGRVRFQLVVALGPPPDPSTLGRPLPAETRAPPRAVIVGDGPCGLFCAYELARLGIASVVVDRGKTVQPRRVDLKGLNRHGVVDEDSNYCFGEGGAGTYSDGKLYTRATKRGDVLDVLETLVVHDAPIDILTDARPHIGSNLLPKVITSMRERLERAGVRFRFRARATDLIIDDGKVGGVRFADGDEERADHVVIATGHSARDIYHLMVRRGVPIAPKPFAVGVRIEHPQPLIDRTQYGSAAGHPKLAAASYRVVENIGGRGVFSFCMCPGGFIVPASTDASGLVVNGMSLKRRDSPFANSGLVVSVEVEDAARAGFTGPLSLLEVQQRIEAAALSAGGGKLRAPATRASDFVAKRSSSTVPPTSYQPGLFACDVAPVLDASGIALSARLREAIGVFDRRMRGFASSEAVLVGVESRTSSPVRIVRDGATLMCPGFDGLFPGGEGAGYAGGIVSAALDGIRIAHRIAARCGVALAPERGRER